jgi:autotransporter strand-loop-strand O-heptosyltransferase
MTEQSLWDDKRELVDFPIYQNYPNPGKCGINLVLNETNHHYFYRPYSGYKIAFNVWESTLQPEEFFKKLLEFNELWVPSKWQKECSVKQGYPEDKIFVIPEGVDTTTFYPDKSYHVLTSNAKRFTFGLFGRWDYRKSTKEIIETFLKTFDKKEPVDLIVSIDNPFSGDKMKSTEDRLKHYGLLDDRIKILHLPPREDYVALMKSMNIFVSCSRSEGWNLPLIEAMACGTPSIYSACCAQLEFAEGRGLPVKILGEKPANARAYNHFNETVGNYYEPDFDDLGKVMRNAYEKYVDHKERALAEAKEIHELYNWDRIAKLAADHLESRRDLITEVIKNDPNVLKVSYHFVGGPHLQITGGDPGTFRAQFINKATGKIEHEEVIKNNMWVSAAKQYYVDWKVKLTDARTGEVFLDRDIDLNNQRVYVSLESQSLGDTLGWFPPIEEFRKKHNCKMICSTFHNEWFKDNYPEIEFVTPGTPVNDLAAMYVLGWFYKHEKDDEIDYSKNPTNPRPMPMQKSQFDILGLDYQEIKPKISIPKVKKKKQVAIAIHATCQAKYWNKAKGWQDVVDWCKSNGYEVVLLSKEEDGFMGNFHPTGIRKYPNGPIEDVMKELAASQAFVGIGSGLSWLSWALDVPTVIISGFSYPYTETQHKTYRVITSEGKCTGCFNRHRLSTDDWMWCPDHKGTERTFECTRSITSKMVIEQLKLALDNG